MSRESTKTIKNQTGQIVGLCITVATESIHLGQRVSISKIRRSVHDVNNKYCKISDVRNERSTRSAPACLKRRDDARESRKKEMKMTETDVIVSLRDTCENTKTVDVPNDDGDATEKTIDVGKFVQEPQRSKNDGDEMKNENASLEDAARNLARNFKCDSIKAKKTKSVAKTYLESRMKDASRSNFPVRRSRENVLANALIKRSIKCLNKMHVMEDVHDGCNAQPSSPGHADQRPEIMQICAENATSDETERQSNNKIVDATEVKLENDVEENRTQIKTENVPSDAKNDAKEALPENDANHINEDSISSDSVSDNALKRKLDSEPSPSKRLQLDIQKNFLIRDAILNNYLESLGCGSLSQIQNNTEQILTEIRSLNEMAKQKEREWNNILHMKKLKEELLLRLQRHKQVLILNNEELDDSFNNADERFQNSDLLSKNKCNMKKIDSKLSTSLYEQNLYGQRNFNGKPTLYNYEMNGQSDSRQNKQRPLKDVKSIIADYRQKHPETVPRRGRRIRSALTHEGNSITKCETSGVLNLSNIALGSGAQVRHNANVDINKDLGLLLNVIGESRKESSQSPNMDPLMNQPDPTSFKDMLIEFAKLSQTERQEILHNTVKPPPPYPEVTVHPVPISTASNSLLHGILTKSQTKAESKSTFSPTLARLLTAPEKSAVMPQAAVNQVNMLQTGIATITDILSSSKARNEITITPVVGQYDVSTKGKQNQEEEEAEDNADRLVIDEGGEVVDVRSRTDNNSDAGDEVPQCQGCNQKPAQFVCAGCGNQWYCSRDCQVSAWDEHSELCSG